MPGQPPSTHPPSFLFLQPMLNSEQTPSISTPFLTPPPPPPPPSHRLPARISVFEIPLVLNLICSHFQSREELESCLNVSRLWRELFLPQIHCFVRFVDQTLDQTWAVVDYAHLIRDLEIDIQDARLFLHTEQSTVNHGNNIGLQRQSLCKNLETLTCVDFGYFSDPPKGLYNLPPPQFDPTTNALGLLAQNPKLCTLRVEYDWRNIQFDQPFTPSVLRTLASHPSLTRLLLKFQNSCLEASFVKTLLIHFPRQLQELEIVVKGFSSWRDDVFHPSWWSPDDMAPVVAREEEQQQQEWGEQVTPPQAMRLHLLEPNSLKRVVLQQSESYHKPIPGFIYRFLGICSLLEEVSLSSSFRAAEREQLWTALKATRSPIKTLDLGRMCPHLLKEVVGILPGLESLTITGPLDCQTFRYRSVSCVGPHQEWSQDRSSFRDLTDLVPTLLQFSALTLVHVQIEGALAIQCLEQCPNLKIFIGMFGSYNDYPTLTDLLAKPWVCSKSLERLEVQVQVTWCFSEDDKDGAIRKSMIQSETYKINRFFHKIKKSSCPRLKKPLIEWYPDLNPWQISLETALDLINRDQDGKLVPVEDYLDQDDILGRLNMKIKSKNFWRRQPLVWRERRESSPPFIDIGRRYRSDFYDEHYFDIDICSYCGRAQCEWCSIEESYDRYYYTIEEKIASGPRFEDRKRLSKTGKSHCRLSPRQKRKQFW